MSEFEDHGERIAKCEREIADLKRDVAKANRPVIQGGDGVDADALADMLDNFKKEMHTMFSRREDVESLADRVKKLEEDYTTMDTTLNQTSDLANNNKEEIEKLKKMLAGKLDCDLFDSEIAKLTQAIQNAGGDVSKVESASNTAFGTKDINRIKEMLDKFPDLEKALEALKKKQEQFEKEINEKLDNSVTKISKDLQDLKDLLDQLMRDMDFLKSSGGGSGGGASPDVIIQVTNKIEKLEIKLGNLENELNSMRRAKAQTVTMPPPQTMTAPTVDEGRIDALEKNLSQLDKDFKKFNNEIIKEIKNHQDQINGKADYSQLDELRDHLLSKIDELLRGFKQFADKNETKKALKNLEKQLKNLYDLVMSRLHPGVDEDDAMFSKKPLGGFSCAS
jgi:DNA repair exonuclease SbcCD ATPase subunit